MLILFEIIYSAFIEGNVHRKHITVGALPHLHAGLLRQPALRFPSLSRRSPLRPVVNPEFSAY